jgi:hypothetical protein
MGYTPERLLRCLKYLVICCRSKLTTTPEPELLSQQCIYQFPQSKRFVTEWLPVPIKAPFYNISNSSPVMASPTMNNFVETFVDLGARLEAGFEFFW